MLMSTLDRYSFLCFPRQTLYISYAFFPRRWYTSYTLLCFLEHFWYAFPWDFRHTLVHDLRYAFLHFH